jgi:hypothetical protein
MVTAVKFAVAEADSTGEIVKLGPFAKRLRQRIANQLSYQISLKKS